MFGFIKDKIKKIYTSFTTGVSSIFSRNKLDEQFLHELSVLLLSADTGVTTTNFIITKLRDDIKSSTITTLEQAKTELEKLLTIQLQAYPAHDFHPRVLLLVGINGSGKTTFVAKLAHKLKQQGKKVMVVAGDTFRAAATQQLATWAERVGVRVFMGRDNQDPASVIFDACKTFHDEGYDHIIIDTAGRLQSKVNLMRELEKIRKIIEKQLSTESINTWLTVDSMLGQNSFAQAEVFGQATQLNGIVLTKLDGTGKGGIVFSITEKLHLPIVYVTFGENLDDLKPFDAQEFVAGLLNE